MRGTKSTSLPSSGMCVFMFGCGQSVPQSTRSGNKSTSCLPNGTTSSYEGEAGAAASGRMQSIELRVRDVATDGRHAARAAAGMDKGVDERAIVGAVAGRLHDDIALEPEKIAQCEQLFLRRVAWRVFARRRVGKRPLR